MFDFSQTCLWDSLVVVFIRNYNKARMWSQAPPPAGYLTVSRLSQPARYAASVWSRSIMKKQPSVGAAAKADLSNVQLAFIPRLTESTGDRWIEATTELFLNLNGEENGTFKCALFISLVEFASGVVVTDPRVLSGRYACCLVLLGEVYTR